MKYNVMVTLAGFLVAAGGYSEEQSSLFKSVRGQARGGTNVAAEASDESVRFNPAAVAEYDRVFHLGLLQADLFMGDNVRSTFGQISSAVSSSSPGVKILQTMDNKFGERQYVGMQFDPLGLRINGVSIVPFSLVDGWLDLRNPSIPNMDWKVDIQAGVAISYAHAVLSTLTLGVTMRPFYRIYNAGSIVFTDILNFVPPAQAKFEDYAPLCRGTGIGFDVGAMYRPTPQLRLGLVVQNIGESIALNYTDHKPPPLPQIVTIGAQYRVPISQYDIDLAADYRDVLNRGGYNMLRLLHLGAELGRPIFHKMDNDLGIAVGLNEGYFTYGAFADIKLVRLAYSKYGVELGEYPGQRVDWRESVTLSAKLDF